MQFLLAYILVYQTKDAAIQVLKYNQPHVYKGSQGLHFSIWWLKVIVKGTTLRICRFSWWRSTSPIMWILHVLVSIFRVFISIVRISLSVQSNNPNIATSTDAANTFWVTFCFTEFRDYSGSNFIHSVVIFLNDACFVIGAIVKYILSHPRCL